MNKLVPLLLVVGVVAGVWFYSTSRQPSVSTSATSSASNQKNPTTQGATPNTSLSSSTANQGTQVGSANPALANEDGEQFPDVKSAAETFKSADEALAAVLKAAKDYDDSVLEQFTKPGNDCTWCPEFYSSVKDMILAGDTPADQKSYLAEILAISGRVENVQSLVEAIKSAKSSDEGDVFSEALELSVGGDDVTKYLGDQMTSTNETLRESSVAAVTNQGSLTAAELLIKHTVERGDPDGYYSLGIGLGEFIPDEEAVPALQAMVQKRDQYSHLAAKALINSGMDGLRTVFDDLETSKDPEADRRMLKDAIDHVNFEDGLEDYLRKKIEVSKQPVVAEFAKRILDEFSQSGEPGAAGAEAEIQP